MNIKSDIARGIGSRCLLPAALFATALIATPVHAARSNAPVSGEIQFITIDNPADHWSGGTITVGGQNVILPRNLLLDLPANRLTLKQLFDQAPAACVAVGETGLAKGDTCNATKMGGIASISANRTAAGNVIAGDALISKGIEAVTGEVTYIDYNDGYFRLGGIPGDPATGTMVRLNDPTSRHTVQQGLGCAAGSLNCSPDPRFTLDPDNYTNVFSSGYPYCIPSTVARTFADVLRLGATVAQALPDGSGDMLCPLTNRTVNGGQPVDDSRRFAPIMLGDAVTAEGNFERVDGIQFLSAHSTMIGNIALSTKNERGQPDYVFLDEVELDAPGYQNQRTRSLFIGFSTLQPNDVLIWSIHRDPTTGAAHEFPLASVRGCDIAAGPGTCGGQGLSGAGNRIWKIRHDVDFLLGAKPRWNPCAHLRADPRLTALNICSTGRDAELNLAEQFAILSPLPREIQARTGHALANPGLVTLDINGNTATNGQYLFPFGANLGGIGFPEFVEVDLNALSTPFNFTGMPWTLDRRLSPGGCNGPCETTPQPLDPYPFEGIDPRTQARLPTAGFSDPNYTTTPLTNVSNRILSYVDASKVRQQGNGFETRAAGNFNGNATVLAWPPADPAALPIAVTPLVSQLLLPNTAPVAVADAATTSQGVAVIIPVLANDTDADGNPLAVTVVTQGANGTVANNGSNVTYTPGLSFTGVDTFAYTISDGQGGKATAPVSVTVIGAAPTIRLSLADFVANPSSEWRIAGTDSTIGATVTVRRGVDLTGPVIGTAVVSANRTWTLRVRNAAILPDASNTISISSTDGATLLARPIRLR